MKLNQDIQQAAKDGYELKANPHLYSSAMWYAHEIGAYLAKTGRTQPYDVSMGRGYTVRANGMLFKEDKTTSYAFARIA